MLRIPYRNKLLLKKLLRVVLIILAALLVLSLVLLLYYEPYITTATAHICVCPPTAGKLPSRKPHRVRRWKIR